MQVLYQLSYSPEETQATSAPLRCNSRFVGPSTTPRLSVMSIPVEPDQLEAELERYGYSAFLLTVRDDETTHVAHMTFRFDQGNLRCPISSSAARNVGQRPKVVVLWPPREPDGYSMIVDADCIVDEDELCVTPTSGVLHRPAIPSTQQGDDCEGDCAPLGS